MRTVYIKCPNRLWNERTNLGKEFGKLLDQCGRLLLNENNIKEIMYLSKLRRIEKRMRAARKDNHSVIDDLLKDGANLYAIWVCKVGSKKWVLKYIGQRKDHYIRERLGQHLFHRHPRTWSQLGRVAQELQAGSRIGVSVLRVLPDELRSSIEEGLTKRNTNLWNIHNRC